jgi:protein TonB
MQAFEGISLSNHSRKQSTLPSVLLVGSLHVAAIYTLLVALDVVPNPAAPTPPINIRSIEAAPPKPQPLPVLDHPVFAQPTRPQPVPVPPIEIHAVRTGPTISVAPTVPHVFATPQHVGATSPLHPIGWTHTIPPYPPLALRLAHEGTARLKISVDPQGNVVTAELVQSTGHEELDAAALAWVKTHWRYQPALKDGDAIAANTEAVVTFRLDQAR